MSFSRVLICCLVASLFGVPTADAGRVATKQSMRKALAAKIIAKSKTPVPRARGKVSKSTLLRLRPQVAAAKKAVVVKTKSSKAARKRLLGRSKMSTRIKNLREGGNPYNTKRAGQPFSAAMGLLASAAAGVYFLLSVANQGPESAIQNSLTAFGTLMVTAFIYISATDNSQDRSPF